jgi:nicotinate-nucleotide pyrophosphorylase (carboxylating)
VTHLDSVSRRLIALALEEDIGPGDVTSQLIPVETEGRARVVARHGLVLAGSTAFVEVFRQVDPEIHVEMLLADGASVDDGGICGEVIGPARSILMGERTALNLLQRLSGIATRARQARDLVGDTNARIVDTRKTTPGLRALEKAAVRAGGAYNHRFGLFDGVLIKDNHVAAAGGVASAIENARARAHHLVRIECECDDLQQVEEAVQARADVILLDNMSTETMRQAVQLVGGRALLEASGGITWERLPEVASTGVDFISMGALTHSVVAADLSLDWISGA